jgi:hypothetical protein
MLRRSPVLGGPPLLLLLLPSALERFDRRERAETLLAAPGVVAVEPARVSYGALSRLPPALALAIGRRQAKRMRLPGAPAAIGLFDVTQAPLAIALAQRHPEPSSGSSAPSRPPGSSQSSRSTSARRPT